MNQFLRYLRAVLWGMIGLGGRQSDARTRVDPAGALPTIGIALVLVILLVGCLMAIATLAAAA